MKPVFVRRGELSVERLIKSTKQSWYYEVQIPNSKFQISLFLVVLLLFVAPDASSQVQTFTLDQSIEYAKQNSPLSRAARFSILSAKWRYKSFRADLLPELSLAGNVPNYRLGTSITPTASGNQAIDFNNSNANIGASISQAILPTGGSLSINSSLSRLGIFRGEDRYEWVSTPITIRLNQPLFQFNNLKWRNRTEPLRYEIAKKQYVEDMEDIAFTATQNYFDLLLAKINVEVAEFNVTVNDSIYNISQGRFQVGSIAENELLQSELEYRNARASLTTAVLEYQRAEEVFKAFLGIEDTQLIEIDVPSVAPEVDVDVQKALELALENNSTSLQFELNELLADQAYEQAKKNGSFSANITAEYGFNDRTIGDFVEVYDNPGDLQSFNIGFQIPLFNWGKNLAEVRSARNQQMATANNIAYQRLQFELSVKSTVREFPQLRSQVELAQVSDEIAARRYDVAKNRYLIGRIDVTDLFIAQNQKDSSRRSYIQSLRSYWIGYYNLRRLTLYDFEQDVPILYTTEF